MATEISDKIILVAHRSQIRTHTLSRLLESHGYSVLISHDTKEALNQITSNLPALVLSDYQTAMEPGSQLCRHIRSGILPKRPVCLILSDQKGDEPELECLENGADEYVRADADEKNLLSRIKALIRRSNSINNNHLSERAGANCRILVVDDSDTYREYVVMELERAGYRVESAVNAGKAMERIAKGNFDVVILDMILPDMNGPRMCERFVKLSHDLKEPFLLLVLTGGEDMMEMTAVLDAGVDDVIGKSRDMKIIKARLMKLIQRTGTDRQ